MSTTKRLKEVKNLLQNKLGRKTWSIAKPNRGLSKETYIAKKTI